MNIVLAQDFYPVIGGAHTWLYEVYRRWPIKAKFLVNDYSLNPEYAEKQRDFDTRNHGSIQIVRKNIAIEEISISNTRCLKKSSNFLRMIQDNIDYPKNKSSLKLHCLRSFPEGVIAMIFKKYFAKKCKVITYVHGEEILVAKTSRQLAIGAKWVYKESDLLIANSHSTQKLLHSFCPKTKNDVVVINPGVNTKAYDMPASEIKKHRNSWGWEEDVVILTTISRMEYRKNHASVIKAIAKLRQEGLPIAYVVGSDGEEKEVLISLVEELNLNRWVQFTGYLTDAEKALTFLASDVHILPSIQVGSMIEGYGIVFLEASAAGVPSIAGNVGGQAEAVLDQETGLVIDGKNLNEVGHAIRKLATNEDLRWKFGYNGRKWAKKNDWDIIMQKTYSAIQNMTAIN